MQWPLLACEAHAEKLVISSEINGTYIACIPHCSECNRIAYISFEKSLTIYITEQTTFESTQVVGRLL